MRRHDTVDLQPDKTTTYRLIVIAKDGSEIRWALSALATGDADCPHHIPGKGCAIYGSHPAECKDYACAWLTGSLPEEMRPDKIGILTSAKCLNEENYLMNKLARQVIGTNNIDHCARL